MTVAEELYGTGLVADLCKELDRYTYKMMPNFWKYNCFSCSFLGQIFDKVMVGRKLPAYKTFTTPKAEDMDFSNPPALSFKTFAERLKKHALDLKRQKKDDSEIKEDIEMYLNSYDYFEINS